jgi:predicted  nucleic acid-binding Zn-ribbon protein
MISDDFRKEEKTLGDEKKEFDSKIKLFEDKRKTLVDRLDSELYQQYMTIMKSTGGLAVVQTQSEVCLGCHTNIPPQLYNDIRSTSDIYTCYHCNRFLYYTDVADASRDKESGDQT